MVSFSPYHTVNYNQEELIWREGYKTQVTWINLDAMKENYSP